MNVQFYRATDVHSVQNGKIGITWASKPVSVPGPFLELSPAQAREVWFRLVIKAIVDSDYAVDWLREADDLLRECGV